MLNILPEIDDIIYFRKAGKTKSNNNKYNKIRENVIYNIFNIDDDYFNDVTYGEEWKIFYDKLTKTIKNLCDVPFSSISIKHMGGMKYNYDFLISFMDENKNIIKNVKTEFKHNNSTTSQLPQFLEIYDKDCKNVYELCSVMSYGEFYYDNFLDSYLSVDNELNAVQKPNKEDYLKNVYDIKYKHEFFSLLYNNKKNKIKEKRQVANNSTKSYLKMYLQTFNFDKINEKIKESQMNKMFLLWDCNNFYIEELNMKELKIKGIKKINNLYFDISTENFKYDIRVRINWGNNNGLANPRWKFMFINK